MASGCPQYDSENADVDWQYPDPYHIFPFMFKYHLMSPKLDCSIGAVNRYRHSPVVNESQQKSQKSQSQHSPLLSSLVTKVNESQRK